MDEELFRKSSLEHLSSREKLDTYIKVTNPGSYLTIAGIFLLLICAAVWAGAANLKTTVPVVGVVNQKQIHLFVSPKQAQELREGMKVEQDKQKIGEILKVKKEPVRRELAGIGCLTEYFRDVYLEKWNVEVVVSNDRKLPEGEEIQGVIVTKESKIFQLLTERQDE